MISRNEILNGQDISKQVDLERNLAELLRKINLVRAKWGKPMTVTSGLRSLAHHIDIYKKKLGAAFSMSKVPMKSKHLYCQAVDILDEDGSLNAWCKANESWLRSIGIWLETRQGNWQHFQIVPFGSYKEGGTIFFNP